MTIPFSVRQYLEDILQLHLSVNGKSDCPHCGHHTLSIKGDTLAKCFHPGCSFLITPSRIQTPNIPVLQQLMEAFAEKCHHFKLDLLENRQQLGAAAVEYIIDTRRIHEDVLKETVTLGIVPYTFDWESFAQPFCGKLTDRKDIEAFNVDVERLKSYAHQGWLMFSYLDSYHQVASIKFRAPDAKNITWFTQSHGQPKGAFDTLLADPEQPAPGGHTVLVEGEFNILQIQSLQKRNCDAYIAGYALGGVDTVDETFLKGLAGRLIHFEDQDEGGRRLTQKLTAIRKLRVVKFSTADEDLDSYIRRHADPREAFSALQTLIADAPMKYRSLEAIKAEILMLLANQGKHKIPPRLVPHEIGKRLVQEFKERGEFLKAPLGPYYLSNETLKVYVLHESSSDTEFLIHSFGLNPALKEYEFAFHELAQEAFSSGRPVDIHWLWHYDKPRNILYYYNSDNQVFRISKNAISECQNGTDGILFQPPEGYESFNLVEVDAETDYFQKYVLACANFGDGGLDRISSAVILRHWLLSQPFDEIHPTRPLATFMGEKGSGKTSLAKRIGQLLLGLSFGVSMVPSKAEEFDVLVTNQPYVVLDNLDDKKLWLNDRLAQAATGGLVERRELYTTNRHVRYPIKSTIAITTRTPQFRRDDVAERLLVFRLERLLKNIPEGQLKAEIQEGRDAFMSWYLLQLQQVVKKLGRTPSINSSFRMADFASFCLRLAMADGEEAQIEMEAIFKRVTACQTHFSIEEDPLCKLLLIFTARYGGQQHSASRILEILKELAREYGLSVPEALSPVGLGQRLSRGFPELNGLVRIDTQSERSNQRLYTLTSIGDIDNSAV